MDNILTQQYKIFLAENSYSKDDQEHSERLLYLFNQQTEWDENKKILIIDCHGYMIKDIYWLMEFICSKEIYKKYKIHLITGVGNHSHKPVMDYYCQREWKNPLYKYIHNYLMEKKIGYRIKEGYGCIKIE